MNGGVEWTAIPLRQSDMPDAESLAADREQCWPPGAPT